MTASFRDRRPARPPTPPSASGEPGRPGPRLLAGAVLAGVAIGGLLLRSGAFRTAAADSSSTPEVVRCALQPLDIAPLPCRSAFLVEAETGAVLYAQNPDERRGPASLVKMMLQLVVFEDIEAGRISLSDSITTSANASTMGGSQVFLKHGEVQTLEALLDAVIIASANDAAMAIAEHLAGSERAFVERMNERAAEIGCRGTRFENVHGLDLRGRPKNVTTARDLGTIARHLVRHPKALEIASTWRKPFRDGEFWLDNTNKLLRDCEGLDGLKTGWTPRAGGCFVGTARRDDVRLIAVILKAPSGKGRFRVAKELLEAGYRSRPHWVQVARAGQVVRASAPAGEVGPGKPSGEHERQSVVAGGSLRVLLERGRAGSWRLRESTASGSDVLGYLDYRVDGRTVATVPAGRPGHS